MVDIWHGFCMDGTMVGFCLYVVGCVRNIGLDFLVFRVFFH